jgi:hypothetical protein
VQVCNRYRIHNNEKNTLSLIDCRCFLIFRCLRCFLCVVSYTAVQSMRSYCASLGNFFAAAWFLILVCSYHCCGYGTLVHHFIW